METAAEIDLIGQLRALSGRRGLVVGDTILDVYLRGATRGLCREAPAPAVAVQAREAVPGGAANTAVNLAAFGGPATLVSTVGDDLAGREALAALRARGVATDPVVTVDGRRTVVKQRVTVGGQTLVRLDEGTVDPVDMTVAAALRRSVSIALPAADALIVSDNGYGTLAHAVIAELAALRPAVPVIVDAKNPAAYRELRPTAATPDYAEAARLLELPLLDELPGQVRQVRERGDGLLDATGAELVVVTLGAAGALLFEPGRPPFHARVRERTDRQVVGAGDVFAAVLALALSAGTSPPVAVELANLAAADAVRVGGTAVGSPDRLAGALRAVDKLLQPAYVDHWAREVHRRGLRITFTNGCFDLVHEGHVAFLSEAKALGDVLVVGVNDDQSVRSLKGPERPVIDLAGRMRLLAAFSCVDHVVPFSGPNPISLIETIRPHVFAKGGDYLPTMLPEAEVLDRLGIEVQILSYLEDRSTTRIIERVRSRS